MEILERVVIMNCPELASIMEMVDSYYDVDCLRPAVCSVKVINSFETLIGVYLDLEDYTEDLDEFLDKIEELDLFEDIEKIIISILEMRVRIYAKFVDLKIFTYKGLIGLIFLVPY